MNTLSVNSLQIGDLIRPLNEDQQPADGYRVVGIDATGPTLRLGPHVLLDWPERGRHPARMVLGHDLENWALVSNGVPDESR